MKKELFLILSFIAITPHMTKTTEYSNSILVGVLAIGIVIYGGYRLCSQSQEQQAPNNSEPIGEIPEPTLSDFTNPQEDQNKPTLNFTNPNKEQLSNNNVPTEEELKQQNKPKPSESDLIKPKKDKPELPGLPPINHLGDLYTKDEQPIQQDIKQTPKSNTLKFNAEAYQNLNDKNFKNLLKQISNGVFD